MLKATVQTHENLLAGSAEEKIDGLVPTVNGLMITLRAYRSLALILNALIVILLAIMEYRAETRQPVIIYQQPQAAQPQREHKRYSDLPQVQAEQPP